MSAFILEITTTTSSETVVIPGTGTGYSYDIDWDDGTVQTGQTSNAPSHVYATAGVYQVAISGTFPRVYYNNGAYKLQPTGIVQWGDENTWSPIQVNAFYSCSNLAGSIPDDSLTIFNSLTIGTLMFSGTSISGSLPAGMTLASLTNGNTMFRGTSISGSLPAGMTLASLTIGQSMFFDTSISGALPAGMTLALVTDGNSMFKGTSISGSLPAGMTLASLTNGNNMFTGTSISADSYSDLLIRMNANNPNNGVTFAGGNAKYNTIGKTARDALTARSWVITDGGRATDTIDLTAGGTGDYTLSVSGSADLEVLAGTAVGTGFGRATEGSPVTFNLSTAGTVVLNMYDGILDTSSGKAIYNIEKGSAASSWIPTASDAPVTRAAESLSYSGIAADNETRAITDAGTVDVDDWDGIVDATINGADNLAQITSIDVYTTGERPA